MISGSTPQAPRDQQFTESEIGDMFLLFCKKLEVPGAKPADNNGKRGASPSSDPKLKEQLLTKSELELRDLRLDLAVIDTIFDKWYKEEENLSGALNMKLIKQKNMELR